MVGKTIAHWQIAAQSLKEACSAGCGAKIPPAIEERPEVL